MPDKIIQVAGSNGYLRGCGSILCRVSPWIFTEYMLQNIIKGGIISLNCIAGNDDMILVLRSAFLLHMKYFECVFLSFLHIPKEKTSTLKNKKAYCCSTFCCYLQVHMCSY